MQAAAFFGLLAAGYLVVAPLGGGAELLAVLLTGSVVAATLVYVLPWVFALDTEPVREDGA